MANDKDRSRMWPETKVIFHLVLRHLTKLRKDNPKRVTLIEVFHEAAVDMKNKYGL